MESVRAPPLPRPASGQVAVTTGTQVRLPLLRDGFWQLHFHPGQLPAKPAQGPWVESRWLHGLSAACPPLLPHSMADKNGALKCTFSAPGHSTSLLQGLAALRAQGAPSAFPSAKIYLIHAPPATTPCATPCPFGNGFGEKGCNWEAVVTGPVSLQVCRDDSEKQACKTLKETAVFSLLCFSAAQSQDFPWTPWAKVSLI